MITGLRGASRSNPFGHCAASMLSQANIIKAGLSASWMPYCPAFLLKAIPASAASFRATLALPARISQRRDTPSATTEVASYQCRRLEILTIRYVNQNRFGWLLFICYPTACPISLFDPLRRFFSFGCEADVVA